MGGLAAPGQSVPLYTSLAGDTNENGLHIVMYVTGLGLWELYLVCTKQIASHPA